MSALPIPKERIVYILQLEQKKNKIVKDLLLPVKNYINNLFYCFISPGIAAYIDGGGQNEKAEGAI